MKPRSNKQTINFEQISDIVSELNSSPPALYFFDKNQENLFFNKVKCQKIELSFLENEKLNLDCSYSEFFDDNKYYYALWIKIKKPRNVF